MVGRPSPAATWLSCADGQADLLAFFGVQRFHSKRLKLLLQ
jgi:hypothetical protein